MTEARLSSAYAETAAAMQFSAQQVQARAVARLSLVADPTTRASSVSPVTPTIIMTVASTTGGAAGGPVSDTYGQVLRDTIAELALRLGEQGAKLQMVAAPPQLPATGPS